MGCLKNAPNYISEMKIVNIGLYVRLCLLKHAFNLFFASASRKKRCEKGNVWKKTLTNIEQPFYTFYSPCVVFFLSSTGFNQASLKWFGGAQRRCLSNCFPNCYCRLWEVQRIPKGNFTPVRQSLEETRAPRWQGQTIFFICVLIQQR